MSKVAYEVVFSSSDWGDSKLPRISIFPRDRQWNDFGYNFLASMVISPKDERDGLRLDLYVIPFDHYGSPMRFPNWFDSRWREVKGPFSHKKSGFLSLLASDEAYRALCKWCKSHDEFDEILFSINEISWASERKTFNLEVINKLVESDPFRLGVIRTAGAYRAFRSGYRFGLRENEEVLDARVPFRAAVQLSGFTEPHVLNVRFIDTALLEDRVHCVVGSNGVGKSRFLRAITIALGSTAGANSNPFNDISKEEYAEQLKSIELSSIPKFSRVIAYSTEVGSLLPRTVRPNLPFDYQYLNLSAPIDLDDEENAYPAQQLMSSMLVDLLRGRKDDSVFDRIGALEAAVSPHLDWQAIAIPLKFSEDHPNSFVDVYGQRWIYFSRLCGLNEERQLQVTADFDRRREIGFFRSDERITVSSGQRTFLRFALHFLSFADKGSLVIIDEPETHLHPNLVSAFSILLYRVLQQTKSIAIVATHSPFVVREVPAHCVHVFKRVDEARVVTDRVYMRTLGASPTSISLAIFGDDSSAKYYEQVVERMTESALSLEDVISEFGGLISPDMLLQLRERLSPDVVGSQL